MDTVMSTQRTSMRKLREILRLRLHAGLPVRQVRDSLRISIGAIQKVTSAAEQQGIDWSTICTLTAPACLPASLPPATASCLPASSSSSLQQKKKNFISAAPGQHFFFFFFFW